MIINDRKKILKLRKRIYILIGVILVLSYWLRQKYLDLEFIEQEVEILQYEILDNEKTILNLQRDIDSIKKSIPKIEKEKIDFKINNKKIENKKDTTVEKANIIEINIEAKDTVNQKQ